MMLISQKILHTDFDHSYQSIKCNVNFDDNANTNSVSKTNITLDDIAIDALDFVVDEIYTLLEAILEFGNGTVITYDRLHEYLKWDKNKIAVLLKMLEDGKVITRKIVYKGQTTGGGLRITINANVVEHAYNINKKYNFREQVINLHDRIERAQQAFSDKSKKVFKHYLRLAYTNKTDVIYTTGQKTSKALSLSESTIDRSNAELRCRGVITVIPHPNRDSEIKINFDWEESQQQILLSSQDVANLCGLPVKSFAAQVKNNRFPLPDFIVSDKPIWRKETVYNFLNKK